MVRLRKAGAAMSVWLMQAKWPSGGITSYQPVWLSSKNPQTINAGKGIERREPSYTVGENVNWYSHYGE